MISACAYWMDRDSRYRLEWTEDIQANGKATIRAVNKLLAFAEADGIVCDGVASGWRPQSVNDATSNAAKLSKHIFALACDVKDPERKLAQWCVDHPEKLAECGLWCEDFRWCAKWNERTQQWDYWCHFQIEPPKSGKRIFIPNNTPPKAPALEGQKPLPDRRVI